MFENDFVMRQIEMMVQIVAKVVFNKDAIVYDVVVDNSGNITGEGELYLKLRSMITNGKINEAENLLFNKIEENPTSELLAIALDFYSQLGSLSDKFLEANNFTKDEALEGLKEVQKIYKIDQWMPQ